MNDNYDVDIAVEYNNRKRADLKEWSLWSIREVANFERVLLSCDSRDLHEVASKMKTKTTSEVHICEMFSVL